MAESEDKSQKTEEPTQKRLEDAHEKGQVASSREVNHWFIILAGSLALVALFPTMMGDLGRVLSGYLENAHMIPSGGPELRQVGAQAIGDTLLALLPTAVLLVGAALAAGLVQHAPVASVEKLKPKLENISLK